MPNRIVQAVRNAWLRARSIMGAQLPEPSVAPEHQLNYRRIWKTSILTASGVAIVPLIIMTVADYNLSQQAITSEFLLRAARIVSNTRRSIGFFMTERRSALEFIVRDNRMETLLEADRLNEILVNLKQSFGGGFMDLGVIDQSGFQRTYVGPFNLTGKQYADQPWFRQVAEQGVYISDVFLGYRDIPHLVVAVRGWASDGSIYILRASLGIEPFERLLSEMELSGQGDAFIINHQGVLQTSSRYHGRVLQKIALPVPKYSDHTEVLEIRNAQGERLIMGYRFLEETPFILMIVKKKAELLAGWYKTRMELILFLVISLAAILSVICGIVTYIVAHIYEADQRRLAALHRVEYANKMASIGRMAAGVAHEINNPLAVINEKAGLIKDLVMIKKAYAYDPKLIGLVDSIIASVKRAGSITKRLLTFSRNMEATKKEPIDLCEMTNEVISFLGKETENRGIVVQVHCENAIPIVETNRGKLQQIFLNIINNALAALDDCGRLDIRLRLKDNTHVEIDVIDNGHGIEKADLHRIFEPFFSTKSTSGGTGLGLSITYNLVREIGGSIDVESEVGKGTRFSVTLPIQVPPAERKNNACSISG
jgi:two-component system NtrC family sensor kinase